MEFRRRDKYTFMICNNSATVVPQHPLQPRSTMMTRHVFLACLATIGIVAHVSATATTPGLRFAVTNPGLTEVKDIALPIINAALKDLTIPDMNLDEHLPIIGHITLDLSDIQVTDFNLPDAALGVSSPPSVALDMSGLTLQVALNYHWRKVHWPHLSSSGSITANPSGGSIVLDMSMSTENGHVVLKSTDCSVDFSGFDVHFHGDLSWLYNFFVWLFKNTIKDSVQSAVQKELLDVVDTRYGFSVLRAHTTTYITCFSQFERCTCQDPHCDLPWRWKVSHHGRNRRH